MDTILVIEDNREIKENIAEILELEGFNVVTVCNGLEGYQIANAIHPLMVICDMLTQKSDGCTFLNLIKKNRVTKHIPVILLSAGSEPLEILKLYVHGVDEFINKPFSCEDLLDAVNRIHACPVR